MNLHPGQDKGTSWLWIKVLLISTVLALQMLEANLKILFWMLIRFMAERQSISYFSYYIIIKQRNVLQK